MIAKKNLSLGLALLVCVSCATRRGDPNALPDAPIGERPALETDEAGFWMHMDRMEAKLKASGRVLTQEPLASYVRETVCKLVASYCPDMRVYVVRQPNFNASMAPNGSMQVWTGLILRAKNEAQLASVLGHEIGHYLRRHAIQNWRDVRTKTNVLVFFQIMTAAAGVGVVGYAAQLAALGSMFAFSRDNEREADDIGLKLMIQAGYDPREAYKLWQAAIEEQEAGKKSAPFFFFATHPSPKERMETLREKAQNAEPAHIQGEIGKERFLAATMPFRPMLLRDELQQRDFAHTQVVLDGLFESGVNVGELHFFQGELYRLRNEEGDIQKAIGAYQEAIKTGDAPAETHRSLGLLYQKEGQKDKARDSFHQYLRILPDAEDQKMIRAYLQELE